MSYVTRRERDALVGLASVFATSFLAGFFSYEVAGTVVYDYSTAVGLLLLVFGGYLAYRVCRRVGTAAYRAGRRRWRAEA